MTFPSPIIPKPEVMTMIERPDDWDLETAVFDAAAEGGASAHSKADLQQLMRRLWVAYCNMEQRAIEAEQARSPSPSPAGVTEAAVEAAERKLAREALEALERGFIGIAHDKLAALAAIPLLSPSMGWEAGMRKAASIAGETAAKHKQVRAVGAFEELRREWKARVAFQIEGAILNALPPANGEGR